VGVHWGEGIDDNYRNASRDALSILALAVDGVYSVEGLKIYLSRNEANQSRASY
jgi:hypothetical protein